MNAGAVLGVDPGTRGGLAVLRAADARVLRVQAFTPGMTISDLVRAVRAAVETMPSEGGGEAYVERVGYIRGDGGRGAFTFGQVAGVISGTLFALGYPPRYVYPVTWQSRLDCLSGGNKNVTKRRAIELFPSVRVTHAVADALLIAEYGRRRMPAARFEADLRQGL